MSKKMFVEDLPVIQRVNVMETEFHIEHARRYAAGIYDYDLLPTQTKNGEIVWNLQMALRFLRSLKEYIHETKQGKCQS